MLFKEMQEENLLLLIILNVRIELFLIFFSLKYFPNNPGPVICILLFHKNHF